MGTFIECVTLDCKDPRWLAAFWAAALDYVLGEDEGHWVVLRPALGSKPLLGFQQVPEAKVVKNRVHLDLRATHDATLDEEVVRLEGLGAKRIRRVVDDPANVHEIMQDPEGNEFCVI